MTNSKWDKSMMGMMIREEEKASSPRPFLSRIGIAYLVLTLVYLYPFDKDNRLTSVFHSIYILYPLI